MKIRKFCAALILTALTGCADVDSSPRLARVICRVDPMPHMDNDIVAYCTVEIIENRQRYRINWIVGEVGDEFYLRPSQVGTPITLSGVAYWPDQTTRELPNVARHPSATVAMEGE